MHFGSFSVEPGAVLLVRGASGCGKSTLLHLLCGVLPIANGSGTATLDQLHLENMPGQARDRLRPHIVGWMPQRQLMINPLSVLDNVLLPVSLAGHVAATTRQLANDLLQALAISELSGQRPATISVGQAARACLARAMVTKPKLLVADEPTASLDRLSTQLVAKEILAFARDGGAAVIASHDPQLRELLTTGGGHSFAELELPG